MCTWVLAPLLTAPVGGGRGHTSPRECRLLTPAPGTPHCPEADTCPLSWAAVPDPPPPGCSAPPRPSRSAFWSSKTRLQCHLSEAFLPDLPWTSSPYPSAPPPRQVLRSLRSISFKTFVTAKAIVVTYCLRADCPSSGRSAREDAAALGGSVPAPGRPAAGLRGPFSPDACGARWFPNLPRPLALSPAPAFSTGT